MNVKVKRGLDGLNSLELTNSQMILDKNREGLPLILLEDTARFTKCHLVKKESIRLRNVLQCFHNDSESANVFKHTLGVSVRVAMFSNIGQQLLVPHTLGL